MISFNKFLAEEKLKTTVMAFGRMNPPTAGHEKLVNKVKEVADEHNSNHVVVLSHSQDAKKNPLSPEAKVTHAKNLFPGTNIKASSKEHPTFLHQASELHKSGTEHLVMVAGSDRVKDYKEKLNQYNGQTGSHGHFNFKKISVVSAGARDPDAEGVEGMSASKMREHASTGNFGKFKEGLPSGTKEIHAKQLYNDVRKGMNVKD
jgi:cytidyltransferase-like protein